MEHKTAIEPRSYPESNYLGTCSCGWTIRIATLNADFALASVARHVEQMYAAEEDTYVLRFTVDGDEITVPFTAYDGKHYRKGESLKDFAWKMCEDMFVHFPRATSVRCSVFAPEPATCEGDYDPNPVVDVAIERDPEGDPDSGRDDSAAERFATRPWDSRA